MQDQLKISLVQTNIIWKDATKNLEALTSKIKQITEETDLILLPEMFSTGFVMDPNGIAETMDGDAVLWMKKTANDNNCAIAGSLMITKNGNYYNRLLFVEPTGEISYYDKKHLFSHADEDKRYTAGTEKTIINYKGWKIATFICYDLRFPVWSRNIEDYDIALYVANWPKPRINAWDTLLKARAIENICYTIGVNRIGIDGNDMEYNGHSQIINPQGNSINKPDNCDEKIISTTLYKAEILTNRTNFKFLNDRDTFTLNK